MKLYKHQQKLLDKNPKKHLIGFDTGLGKTLTSIKLAEKNVNNCLVICPKSLTKNWEREFKKWISKKNFSYDILTKETFRRDWNILPHYDCLICDEIHYFSNFKAKMTKALINYIRKYNIEYLYGLSATPVNPNNPFTTYTLAMIFGYYLNYAKFKQQFIQMVKMGARTVPKPKKGIESQLISIIKKFGTMVKKEEAIDLPEQIFLQEDFELTQEQKSMINMLKEKTQKGEMNSLSLASKVSQITGGTLKGNNIFDDLILKSPKRDRLVELVLEHKKVVIFCHYSLEIIAIKNELEKHIKTFTITGKTKERQAIFDEFEKTKECAIVINCAISEGYSLISSNIIIYYSNDFSWKNRYQSMGRIHRVGQKNSCIYIDLVVNNSSDEKILKTLKKKEDFQIELFGKELLLN